MSVNSNNFAIAIAPIVTVAPQTVASASSVNGTTILLAGNPKDGAECGFIVAVGSVGGGTVTAKLQYSDDSGSTWTDYGASLVLSAAGAKAISIGDAMFGHDTLRIVLTTTGTNATIAAIYTPFQLMQSPPSGFVAGTDYLALSN